MKKRPSIILALLIFAGTAGAEWTANLLRPSAHEVCYESRMRQGGWLSFDDNSLQDVKRDSNWPSGHSINDTEGNPVDSEELGRTKGGSLNFYAIYSANTTVSAITLWDEIKPKRSILPNQVENQVMINQSIRR